MRVIERSEIHDAAGVDGAAMVAFTLDLEELEDYPTDALPGFIDQLLSALPALEEHPCRAGEAADLVPNLHAGLGIEHLVMHVALELLILAGLAVERGEQGVAHPIGGHPGVYRLTLPSARGDNPAFTLTASRMALELVASLLPPDHRPVLGLGLLSAPIETADADGSVPGLAALTRMLASGNAPQPTTTAMGTNAATLDLLAPVDLLTPVDLLAPVPATS